MLANNPRQTTAPSLNVTAKLSIVSIEGIFGTGTIVSNHSTSCRHPRLVFTK